MDPMELLRELDGRIAAIPAGSVEIHARGGDRVAFRISKAGGRTRFERIGLEGGPEHLEAVRLLGERRALARRRRDLAREIL